MLQIGLTTLENLLAELPLADHVEAPGILGLGF
jgi:hypothetical protein